jgi:FkbM family methyltransferase
MTYDSASLLARVETPHGVFHAVADDHITNQLVLYGAHTRNELAMVLDHVRDGDVFVDIGAHIGTFAIPVARKLGQNGKLLAIEGAPETHALLERNIGANGLAHRIQTVCAIVGDAPRKLRRVDVEGNTGAGFYRPDVLSDWCATDARTLVCAYGFARLDFLKLDVEGMEALVIRSMAPLFAARRPKLYIEMVASQLARFGGTLSEIDLFLRSFGYRFFCNTGERNSTDDQYIKTELSSLEEGGGFFDLLALSD